MSYINSVSTSLSTYSVDRRSDIKAGIIKLNRVSIRVNAGDSLQSICNKINAKKSSHGVAARIETVLGRKVISLSSPRQIDILDRNNILNNIGVRIRANLARNDLISGLVLTELANISKVSCRHIFNPYQICEAPINNLSAVPAIREEINNVDDDSLLTIRKLSKFDNEFINDSNNDFNSSRLSNDIPNINNQEEREESKEAEKIELFKNEKNPTIQAKSEQPVRKKKAISFDPHKKNVKDPIIPVKSEQHVHKKGTNSFDIYKELKGAERTKFFTQIKGFLREKAISVQDEKAPKYTLEMINKGRTAPDICAMYDKASPLKKDREDRWK